MTPCLSWRARLIAGLFIGLMPALIPAWAAPTPLTRACDLIGGRLKSVGVKTCQRAGLRASGVSSRRGVPLIYRDYAPRTPAQDGAAKRVLMIGGIHGDELTSVSIAFAWMQKLEKEREQPFKWRVIPASNPDGLLAKPSTRTNASGVDLNRNFPTADWANTAQAYWTKRTRSDPRRFPGKAALSEPETRWLTEQIKTFKPDAIVAIHAPYGILDYDGRDEPPEQFGYLRLQRLGTYPGSLGNYGYSLGIPVITLELPSAGNMPTPAQTQRVWADMLTWLQQNLQEAAAQDAVEPVAETSVSVAPSP